MKLADVTAANGVVHSIDEIIWPGKPDSVHEDDDAGKDFVSVLKSLGFTSFASALEETKMDVVLRSEGGFFTVFAPTNAAFDHPESYGEQFSLEDRVRFHVGVGVLKPYKIESTLR